MLGGTGLVRPHLPTGETARAHGGVVGVVAPAAAVVAVAAPPRPYLAVVLVLHPTITAAERRTVCNGGGNTVGQRGCGHSPAPERAALPRPPSCPLLSQDTYAETEMTQAGEVTMRRGPKGRTPIGLRRDRVALYIGDGRALAPATQCHPSIGVLSRVGRAAAVREGARGCPSTWQRLARSASKLVAAVDRTAAAVSAAAARQHRPLGLAATSPAGRPPRRPPAASLPLQPPPPPPLHAPRLPPCFLAAEGTRGAALHAFPI